MVDIAADLRGRWRAFEDGQHRLPSGLAGLYYGRRMARQHAPETDWTLGLLGIRPGDVVLELGPGDGRALAEAARLAGGGLTVGLDRSPAMLRACAWRCRAELRAGRAALVRGDLQRAPVAGPRFDRIYSVHTFYFWERPEALGIELCALLRPAGRLAVTFATGERGRDGTWRAWPVRARAEAVVDELRRAGAGAELRRGPDSRQFDSLTIVAGPLHRT
jgi:SAM-dependent methyltransferase